jgi:hypothetical protein
VELGAQSATRTANDVIRTPFFAPAACWWARTIDESTRCSDCGGRAASASKIVSAINRLGPSRRLPRSRSDSVPKQARSGLATFDVFGGRTIY